MNISIAELKVGPCCAPRKMSAINMLYLDADQNVIVGKIPNMKVERCGCSWFPHDLPLPLLVSLLSYLRVHQLRVLTNARVNIFSPKIFLNECCCHSIMNLVLCSVYHNLPLLWLNDFLGLIHTFLGFPLFWGLHNHFTYFVVLYDFVK